MSLIKILNDDSPMPLGKFRGTMMANVPFHYLLWYETTQPLKKGQLHDSMVENDKAIRAYIADNKDVLLAEQKQARQNGRNYMFDPYK